VPDADPAFEEHRSLLTRLAYRMLGSLADADDVLQEAYLRWSRADHSTVQSPRAFLSTLVTRLCIDQRRAADARRETYVGPWLPEPVVESDSLARQSEISESLSLAFLVVLESLGPVERAAYLLREAFDYEYPEIAGILGKSEANCRQLVSRAQGRLRERRPRFDPAPGVAEWATEAFLQAVSTGDVNGLVDLLAEGAVALTDGGGKATAARLPVVGADRVARFFIGLAQKVPIGFEIRRVLVNGQPGLVTLAGGQVANVLTFDVDDAGKILACYVIRNPDKLARVFVD
jgi:RNA polymerase sigma-70 factor (ECF subfamily)